MATGTTAVPGAGGTDEPPMTVDELAARAGVTVRTIRFYGTRGLLPPPVIGPRRVGHYGPGHLSRLALIEELQRQGMTLAAVERYLEQLPPDIGAHDLAIHRALVASWVPDSAEVVTREQLERRLGRRLGDDDIDKLEAMGAVARGPGPGTYHVDPGLLMLAAELLDIPIAYETILAARTILLEHTRSVAHELTRLFRDEVWQPYRDREPGDGPGRNEESGEPSERGEPGDTDAERAEAMRTLSAPIRPLIVQALVTAFQRSMKEELRSAFGMAADRPAVGPAPGDPGR
ncbi:MerR family transcriptional regulator [Streptomyces qinzhouensis]|uniref:MerR family transcriptional regulator n=1 Tax=Streptomyces qinzhouensis TaxID=2599401 RepID=A0A5B8JER4_9ACTN|nr:MerR family transcriptional regulator [Streptomyces qinzhouensis]QDY79936.1 MerR family transcriptional regulator [Streptomyces qinzhouensis]